MERGTPQVGPARFDWGQPSIFRSSSRTGLYRVRVVAPKNKGLTPSTASCKRRDGERDKGLTPSTASGEQQPALVRPGVPEGLEPRHDLRRRAPRASRRIREDVAR